jgi:hypothetical protein
MVLALADKGYTIAREGDWRPPEKPGYEHWYARYFVAINTRYWRAVKDGWLEGAVVCAPPDSCMEADILEASGYARTVLARNAAEPAQSVRDEQDESDDATAPAVDAVGRA